LIGGFFEDLFIFCLQADGYRRDMVTRRRFRGFFVPVMAYLISGSVAGYFVNEASNGSRGIETRNSLMAEIARKTDELATLTAQRVALERRNAALGLFSIDMDLLEERSRIVLGTARRNEVVIMETGGVVQN
jgi:cell division protein FtsB